MQLPCQGFVVRHVDEKGPGCSAGCNRKEVEERGPGGGVPFRDGYSLRARLNHSDYCYYYLPWANSRCRSSCQDPLLPQHFQHRSRPAAPSGQEIRRQVPVPYFHAVSLPVPTPPVGPDPAF